MRNFVGLVFLLAFGGNALAQKDSIQLKSVVISAEKPSGIPGLNPVDIDSTAIHLSFYTSIAEVLEYYSPIGIKNYGSNGAQTVTFRGMNSSHTQVFVNGLNINSPSLGQTDLGTLPTYLFSGIQLKYGATSMTEGVGALGGGVMLNSKVETLPTGFSGNLGVTLGSFSNQSYTGSLGYANKNVKAVTRLIYQQGENDFTYRDITTAEEKISTQKHAFGTTFGLSQSVDYKMNNQNKLQFFGWYVQQDKQLPALMTESAPSSEKQFDEQVGLQLGWVRLGDKAKSELVMGNHYSVLDYRDSVSNIQSTTFANRFQIREDYTRNISSKWALNLQAIYAHSSANNPNLNGIQSINEGSVKAGVNGKIKEKLEIGAFGIASLNNTRVDLLPMLSLAFLPLKSQKLIIGLNASQNVRYPSLNDLYWYPGGNPDLVPEKSSELEFNVSWNSKVLKHFDMNAKVTGFNGRVENWIQWTPTSFNYWSPQNIKIVQRKGLEIQLELKRKLNKWLLAFNGSYQFVQSTNDDVNDDSYGKQLIYTPEHSANWLATVGYQEVYLNITYRYVGERYISSDNSSYLPNYDLLNLALNKQIRLKSDKALEVQLEMKNVFDKEYMSVAWRPMAGRNYAATLRYTF